MKKRKGVYVEMGEAELKAYKKAKGDRTHRQILLGGVGLPSVEKRRGRPFKSDVELDLERLYAGFDEANKQWAKDKLSAEVEKGLDPATSIRMLGDESPWTEVTCSNCQNTYFTKSRVSSKCWRCSRINYTPRKPQPIELQSEPTFLNKTEYGEEDAKLEEVYYKLDHMFKYDPKAKDDLVEEEYQGNASYITLSERAKRYHNISDDDWDALTEKEKLNYIFKLPPSKEGQTKE